MDKEFCIQYPIYADGEKQYNDDSVTIKIKTGDEISEKEIPHYKSFEFADTLQELGYRQVYLKGYVDYDIEKQEERVKQAEKDLECAKEMLKRKKEYAENIYYKNLCNWFWDD